MSVDMSETVKPKSDQINADDCICGPLTGEVVRVYSTGNSDQPVAIQLTCHDQPFKPCKGQRRVLIDVWGVKGDEYVGKSLRLFRNPEVKYGGIQVGGLEISHVSGIDKPRVIAVTVSRGKKKPQIVEPLVADKAAAKSKAAKQSVSHDADVVNLCLAYQKVKNDEGLAACKVEATRLWPLIDESAKASITARVAEAKARIAKPAASDDHGASMHIAAVVLDPTDAQTALANNQATLINGTNAVKLLEGFRSNVTDYLKAGELTAHQAELLTGIIDEKLGAVT